MDPSELNFDSCLYYASGALQKKLNRMAEEVFREVGLAPSYVYLLMAVNAKPGIQPSELAELLQLNPSTVTRLVEKMEQQEYLSREPEGRRTQIEPTKKGRHKNRELQEAWQKLKDRYKGLLGERYYEVLTEMVYTAKMKLEEE